MVDLRFRAMALKINLGRRYGGQSSAAPCLKGGDLGGAMEPRDRLRETFSRARRSLKVADFRPEPRGAKFLNFGPGDSERVVDSRCSRRTHGCYGSATGSPRGPGFESISPSFTEQ